MRVQDRTQGRVQDRSDDLALPAEQQVADQRRAIHRLWRVSSVDTPLDTPFTRWRCSRRMRCSSLSDARRRVVIDARRGYRAAAIAGIRAF
jgi:hypothetical protein